MELIFKKYHVSKFHTEKNYLIYDPARNRMQFNSTLLHAIWHRNFGQSYENILIGPIVENQKITVRVLNADGEEVSSNPGTMEIFQTYLKDQGYAPSRPDTHSPEQHADIQAYGTVYYYPA